MNTTPRILDVTLPLSPAHQIEYFKDKAILFSVDIPGSRITPRQCFMTLSNMKLKAEIKTLTSEIITEYMTGNALVETTNMAKVCANIILGFKFQHMPYIDVDKHFSMEQYAEYIVQNQEMIQKWCDFISSVPLYLLTCTKFLENEDNEALKKDLPKIEGRQPEIGVNFSQILALPDFLMAFFTKEDLVNLLEKNYYPYYFDEYIYSGDRLISFITSKKEVNQFAMASLNIMKFLKERNPDQMPTENEIT